MAPKSISIPPNPSTRIGVRRAAARKLAAEADHPVGPDLVPPVPPRRQAGRPVQSAPTHRYHIGERLRLGGGGYSVARIAAVCKVLALLPYEGRGSLLYRVRSEAEAFERVVSEADLSRG